MVGFCAGDRLRTRLRPILGADAPRVARALPARARAQSLNRAYPAFTQG